MLVEFEIKLKYNPDAQMSYHSSYLQNHQVLFKSDNKINKSSLYWNINYQLLKLYSISLKMCNILPEVLKLFRKAVL